MDGMALDEAPGRVDLLVVGGDVVTMDAQRRVVVDATIAVRDGVVHAIGTAESLRQRHPGSPELDATGCLVVPGLVNAHQHTTSDPLVRSLIPDDIPSAEAIDRWILPVHEQVTGEDDELAAMITAVDCLTRGVTTVLEPGSTAHPLRAAAGLAAAGIRGRVGPWGWDLDGGPHTAPAPEVLDAIEEVVGQLDGSLVSGWVTLVGHATASDALMTGAAALAERLDVPMTMHMSPGDADGSAYAGRSGLRPIQHLERLGVLGPRLVLAHAVWLDDAEVDLVLSSGTAVVSCPAAYLRLGQGYARAGRHGELVRRGGRVALGCDSHNAGDAPDVLAAARLLAGLERDRGEESAIDAGTAYSLATAAGAAAVGMGKQIGSIEVGKAADLVVLDLDDIAWIPRGDLPLQLLWGAASSSVRDVVVDGRVVVRDRRCTTVDTTMLRAEATARQDSLLARAGLTRPSRWPLVEAASW
jgi:5-methylthioadenosine/S-adenosylhomocysteine deaminase